MRTDCFGIFWQDAPAQRVGQSYARPMPPIPDTGWQAPRDFPNLRAAAGLSIDVETFDPELLTKGPGWARGVGHLVGVSVGVPEGQRWYFPMRHEVEREHNIDPAAVLRWLVDTLGNPAQPKAGANLLYDIGWLRQEGVHVQGQLVDVQFAEALLAERGDVNLDTLGEKYLGEGKTSSVLYQWCADFYGGEPTGKQRANIYRTPPRLVGPYAESDVDLPLRIAARQYPLLEREGLLSLFEMECALIPLLVEMRFAGVAVDINKAAEVRDALHTRIKIHEANMRSLVGFDVNVNAGESIASAFDALHLPYNKTATGKPSFTKQFLNTQTHPVAELIKEIRKLSKLSGTFIESYILDAHVNGKVYGQFHPLRSDDGGTRSGRYSSSLPNLQNLPSRDEELAPLVRGMFVPDYGHKQWRKYDYSQIEYRGLAHYAVGPGADAVRQIYHTNPDTDYHVMTQELVKAETGIELGRKPTKNINFGLIYGMGPDTLAAGLGLSRKEADHLFAAYHKGAPFIKATMDATVDEVNMTGVITTILGRRARFDLWEPRQWDANTVPLPYNAAVLKYGLVRRAYTYKALNRRLQGSAADMLKMAMLICWRDGIFAETGVPRLTVHDELDFSDPGGKEDAFAAMQHVLETAVPMRVPIKADCEVGPDWGHVA